LHSSAEVEVLSSELIGSKFKAQGSMVMLSALSFQLLHTPNDPMITLRMYFQCPLCRGL
jgi:hypothetical protein